MLRCTVNELFDWRFMQTDPNWGNFLFDPETGERSRSYLALWTACLGHIAYRSGTDAFRTT